MEYLQPKPPGFIDHSYAFDFTVNSPISKCWEWLNTPETFTDSQIPPFRVEFYSPDPDNIPNGFHEGVLNTHHGPFINFPGILTKIEEPRYRDLQYYYGSYAFSMRWIRPHRLQFWLTEMEEKTSIKVQLDSYAKPWIAGFWQFGQKIFWSTFPRWARRSIPKLK